MILTGFRIVDPFIILTWIRKLYIRLIILPRGSWWVRIIHSPGPGPGFRRIVPDWKLKQNTGKTLKYQVSTQSRKVPYLPSKVLKTKIIKTLKLLSRIEELPKRFYCEKLQEKYKQQNYLKKVINDLKWKTSDKVSRISRKVPVRQ